jgi:hypothetical protein
MPAEVVPGAAVPLLSGQQRVEGVVDVGAERRAGGVRAGGRVLAHAFFLK